MSAVKPQSGKSVAVIGAGWAGCAAAVELVGTGHRVALFESTQVLGGRARQLTLDGKSLDNGQHILLGAYGETLALLKKVGIDRRQAFLRLPLQMRYPAGSNGMDFVASHLPAPLHLLVALCRSRGLAASDRLALARFSTAARWMDWQLHVDCTVSEMLARFDQTDRLIQLMWRPLCIAALNTAPEKASAQIFLKVLGDSLGARRADSDMLIPRTDLSALFPDCAARYVARHDGQVFTGTTIKKIVVDNGRWLVELIGDGATTAPISFDAVIVATQARQAARLLNDVIEASALHTLDALCYEPITTCYLQYAPDFRLTHPFLALLDDPHSMDWAQFVFDRGQLNPDNAGLLAAVVSTSAQATENGQDALADAIAAQLARALGRPELRHPQWSKVVTDKRATFSCTPALQRPENASGMPGLLLAGDYTASDYPATLESAIRSGRRAAGLLHAESQAAA